MTCKRDFGELSLLLSLVPSDMNAMHVYWIIGEEDINERSNYYFLFILYTGVLNKKRPT